MYHSNEVSFLSFLLYVLHAVKREKTTEFNSAVDNSTTQVVHIT